MGTNPEESPGAAFGLAVAGGIFIILGGIAGAVIGAIFTFFIFGVGGIVGILGIIWGILVIFFAFRLKSRPEQHTGIGVVLIILSLLSFVGAFGGFILGFILTLVAGILALIWSPSAGAASMSSGAMPTPTTVSVSGTGSKFCPSCGAPVEAGAKFCKSCGKPL